MNFNQHLELKGLHAFLSASSNHWLNYDDEKLITRYSNHKAKELGTRLHAFAEEAISLGIKLPRTRKTINSFVNDAIGHKMETEQILYYSEFCFGTADAISFKNNTLRIHDLKTGITPVTMTQLLVYSSLFCLEYGINPTDISIILRIYQNDEIEELEPESEEILYIMNKIIDFDKLLREQR